MEPVGISLLRKAKTYCKKKKKKAKQNTKLLFIDKYKTKEKKSSRPVLEQKKVATNKAEINCLQLNLH